MADTDKLAARWRRLLAFIVDYLLIALICWAAGAAAADWLLRIQDWGRLVGFGIVMGYFAVFDSVVADGSSPGKRLLGVQVVTADGSLLSPARAAARAGIIYLPFVLNGLYVTPNSMAGIMIGGVVLAVALVGVALAALYLFLFNWRTRQSLHDWVTSTVVIRRGADVGVPAGQAIWRGHLAITAGILLVMALVPPVLITAVPRALPGFASLDDLMTAQQAIASRPDVVDAGLQDMNYSSGVRQLEISAVIEDKPATRRELARSLAREARKAVPSADRDRVVVLLRSGWTLGLVSSYSSQLWRFE